MEGSIDITLTGDHALNLHALATLIGLQQGFRVVSVSKNAGQLRKSIARGTKGMVQASGNGGTTVAAGTTNGIPEIVLFDINFDLHKISALIALVRGERPDIRIAALGLTKDPAAILRLLHLGVDTYIPKTCDPEQLEDILRKLAVNGRCTTAIMERARGTMAAGAERLSRQDYADAWPPVTASEGRFFRLAMSEASDEDIRRRMNLCESTFARLVARVYRLFGVRSRNGLVLALYRRRMLIRDDL